MKGVILAGGLGSRLRPLTKVTNKHLLPVYDRPMIYYPIETLCDAGIDDIMIVTGGNSAGDFLRLLGNGKEFGLKDLHYTYQDTEGGIADALKLCEHFADGGPVVVILGDNIVQDSIAPYVRKFEAQETGARILLKDVTDPERFGCPQLSGDRIVRIEEKPSHPKSRYAVTGIYMYDRKVFEFCRRSQTVRARRARDHRRQQRLYPRRRAAIRRARRLVGGRRTVRIAIPRRYAGGRVARGNPGPS